jgi:hypothetical protein
MRPTDPPTNWVHRVIFPVVEYLVHEHDSSLPSSAEVKNEWSYTSPPPVCLHGMHRNNLNFYPLWCLLQWQEKGELLNVD